MLNLNSRLISHTLLRRGGTLLYSHVNVTVLKEVRQRAACWVPVFAVGLQGTVEETVGFGLISVWRHWLSALQSVVIRLVLLSSEAAVGQRVCLELVDVLSSGVLGESKSEADNARVRVSEQWNDLLN